MKNSLYFYFSFIIPIVMIGLVFSRMSVLFAIVMTLFYFIFLNRYELSAALMLAFPQILGMVKSVINFGLPASVVLFAVVIVFLNVQLVKLINKNLLKTVVFTALVLAILFISVFFGGYTESSVNKIVDIAQMALASLVGFAILFTYSEIDFSKVAVSFLVVACLYLAIAYEILSYPTPSSFFDFSSFRAYSTDLKHIDFITISYHRLGYCGVLFLSYLFTTLKKGVSFFQIVLMATAFWIILFSGARQAIVAGVFVIVSWCFLRSHKGIAAKFVFMGVMLAVFYFFISSLQVFQDLGESSSNGVGSAMNRDYEYPLKVISENPLLGVGLGNYYDPYGGRTYAHNIILELFSETGVVGFFLIVLVLVLFLVSIPRKHIMLVKKNKMGLILILPYVIRCFISGGIQTNVQVFVLIFAYFSFVRYHVRCIDISSHICNKYDYNH